MALSEFVVSKSHLKQRTTGRRTHGIPNTPVTRAPQRDLSGRYLPLTEICGMSHDAGKYLSVKVPSVLTAFAERPYEY